MSQLLLDKRKYLNKETAFKNDSEYPLTAKQYFEATVRIYEDVELLEKEYNLLKI